MGIHDDVIVYILLICVRLCVQKEPNYRYELTPVTVKFFSSLRVKFKEILSLKTAKCLGVKSANDQRIDFVKY